MKKLRKDPILLIVALLIQGFAVAQQNDTLARRDTLIKKIDSLGVKADTSGSQVNDISTENYNETTRLNVNTYFLLLGNDFKQQVVLPFKTKKSAWVKVAGFGLLTAGFSFSDKAVNRFAVGLSERNKGVATVSRWVTNTGGMYEAISLAGLATYGVVFKNEKVKTTALLASQAYITSAVMFTAIKTLTGRQRPIYYDPKSNKNSPRFHGPLYQFRRDASGQKYSNNSYTSFPSGHTTVAFAAATVFAMEYHDRPLIPLVSYSAATLIGLSRITENKHWPTDVLAGAGLGYLIGRQVVNNYHRYAKVKSGLSRQRQKLSFHLQSVNGVLVPGLSYHIGKLPAVVKRLP